MRKKNLRLLAALIVAGMLAAGLGTVLAADKVKLTVAYTYNVESFLPGEDENNNEIINYLREKSGFDIHWIILPPDQPWEKVNLMLASGDPPDIIYCPDKNQFGNWLHQGALARLDEYLTDTPNLDRLVPEDAWGAVTWEGGRYAVPIPQNQRIAGTTGIFVRTDWLDELGIERPETLDEYYDMMVRLKNDRKVIPLTAAAANGLIDGFTGAFGIGTAYKVKDGKIVCSYIEPEAKEYLAYMNKLYREGLLDMEFPVNKGGNVQEKMVSGQAAMAPVGWWDALPIDRNFTKLNPDGKLEYIKPPVGPRGEWGIPNHGPVRTFLVVPAQSRRIKEAVEFLEFMADPEVYNYVSFGLEGVHYYEENGEKFLTEEYENRRWQIYYTLVDTQEGFAIRLRDKGFKEYSDQVVDYCILENIDAYAPPLPELMDRSAELSEVIEEYYARFITGDLGLDRFDDFVRQWRRRGGDSVLDELNKWYEEYAG